MAAAKWPAEGYFWSEAIREAMGVMLSRVETEIQLRDTMRDLNNVVRRF